MFVVSLKTPAVGCATAVCAAGALCITLGLLSHTQTLHWNCGQCELVMNVMTREPDPKLDYMRSPRSQKTPNICLLCLSFTARFHLKRSVFFNLPFGFTTTILHKATTVYVSSILHIAYYNILWYFAVVL